MDFGEVVRVRSKFLNDSVVLYNCVRRPGYVLKFSRKKDNIYRCCRCRELGKQRLCLRLSQILFTVLRCHHPLPENNIDGPNRWPSNVYHGLNCYTIVLSTSRRRLGSMEGRDTDRALASAGLSTPIKSQTGSSSPRAPSAAVFGAPYIMHYVYCAGI